MHGDTGQREEWWTQTLLNQAASAHPIFGRDLQAQVEGDVITLTGRVERGTARGIEAEARSIDYVHHVVNNLVVAPQYDAPYHMQTVIGCSTTSKPQNSPAGR
jgi:osmotically-inducible protein OsmY